MAEMTREQEQAFLRQMVIKGTQITFGRDEKKALAILDKYLAAYRSEDARKPSRELFYKLVIALGQSDQVKYTANRGNKLRARLKMFTDKELLDAANAIYADPWMMGENPQGKVYAKIDYLILNDENVDKWRLGATVPDHAAAGLPRGGTKLNEIEI